MFVTPLGLETVEKLCGHASVALIALHPSFIVQRIYAGCAAARHLQPLTATVLTGLKSIYCSLERCTLRRMAFDKHMFSVLKCT